MITRECDRCGGEAHQTMLALRDARDTKHADGKAASDDYLAATAAYLAAKRARGGL